MKKLFIPYFILFACTNLSAQLTWLNPTPSGWPNTKIQFINKSTGYLMNSDGNLFITKDTGNSWQSHGHFPDARTFRLQDSIGIIPGGDSSIYLSDDNGLTWHKSLSSPTKNIIRDWCEIIGRDTLFVLAYNTSFIPGLYRSVNRGSSWQLMNNEVYPLYAMTIDFLTAQKGFQLRPGGIFNTIDGGVSWQQMTLRRAICIKFYDTLQGIAVLANDSIIRTEDGGTTWITATYKVPALDIYDIFYVDRLHLYAVGELGYAYRSNDGGDNWTILDPTQVGESDHLLTQYFFDVNNGIVAGLRGLLLRTRDGGASWEKHSPTYTDITGISFGNEATGYASTWYNIYKTMDSGKTWNPLGLSLPNFGSRFRYCYFISADTGFVSSNAGASYLTTDGGQTWTTSPMSVPVGFTNNPSINFFTRDSGYLAAPGSPPILYKTTTGGSSWQEVARGQRCDLLFFLSDKFGYSTLYDRVYRTSDGGLSWLQMPVPPADQPFTAMWFVNAAKGFTVARAGQMKMTLDSGYSWTDIILKPYALPHYQAIRFYNDKIGYATDEQGVYYKTIDGGYHWKKDGTVAYYECRNILFRPDSTVLFAGLNGAIASRNIADYSIDSVQVVTGACNAELRAKISAFLSPVDSIWFEYGKVAYTDTIIGTPSSVADTTLHITTTLNNLQPDSIYHARVKVLFKGKYYYSPDFTFKSQKTAAPVITASGNILSSSAATGNQWYLNGTPIAGATNQQYTATAAGAYTVIAMQGNCTTLESAPFNHVVTSVPDITAWDDEIKLFPNPVIHDEINIVIRSNNRRLTLQIADIGGRLIKEQALNIGSNLLSLAGMQSGLYIFSFTDFKTHETVKRKILKF